MLPIAKGANLALMFFLELGAIAASAIFAAAFVLNAIMRLVWKQV